ncbi:MAG: AAA family ATPase [Syntrophales bacterium]|jgi:chromosome partitioning protein|nr:AAA family ATPase [Syntrophales bacterium]MDD4339776.1 ParA family protein [Syntrophales bacterium]HOG07606.1 ParA family protein [Syntrophales bacterium]HOS77623.1 ParA family protein [Syntrophales bacterium]HPB70731.1 ParA family protein [Syntrophales bacterium]
MAKILCIANQKGGVGKTTTAINLAASIAAAERRTLLIDCDAQGNASTGLGVSREAIREQNLYQALIGKRPLKDVIVGTMIPQLDIVPADQDLIGIEVEFVPLPDREKKLRTLVRELDTPYEFIILDCPPSLGFMTLNALVAADALIIPLQCEYFAMEGLGHLLNTLRLVKAHLNPSLQLGGILLTMFDTRNLLSHRVSEDVRRHFGSRVFQTYIPRNVRLSESPSHGLPILLYDIRSRGALSYMDLAKEILANGRR